MNDEISLLMLWIVTHELSNLKLLTRKTYSNSMIQQQDWLELVLHGDRIRGTQQVKYVGNTDVCCFGF